MTTTTAGEAYDEVVRAISSLLHQVNEDDDDQLQLLLQLDIATLLPVLLVYEQVIADPLEDADLSALYNNLLEVIPETHFAVVARYFAALKLYKADRTFMLMLRFLYKLAKELK